MQWLVEYGEAVLKGKIVACHRIKQVYKLLLDKLEHPNKYKPWVFDEDLANFPIEFIETCCKQSQGEIGKPLKLELFQKAKHQAVFGFVHEETGYRQYTEVLDIRGRKNGKTTELAADSNYLLVADGEGAPEIYFIATALDQSKKGFNEANNMRLQSPLLHKRIRKRASDLYAKSNLGFIKALASNSNSLDGLNSHAVIIDELAAIKNRDIYDLMKQSIAAQSRKQPLLTCITTNGFVRNGIFDSQYDYACGVLDGKIPDDRFLPLIYELDERDEWTNPKMWIKANPGLGTIKSIEDLEGYVRKAKNDPAFLPTVLVKDFNLKENASSRWLNWETLNNEVKFDFPSMKFRYCIGGFDAADTTDLNSAKALCMKPGDDHIYTKSMYWMPEAKYEEMLKTGNRRERDNVPYSLWVKQGLLRLYPGNKVNKICFLEWYKELMYDDDVYIYKIGYDPWHIDDTLLSMFKAEFGKKAMVEVRQGVKTLSAPMKELKADLDANRIIYNNNPIDKWCLSNTEVKTDTNGNIQPDKGQDTRQRIDGAVSLINGYVVLNDNLNDYLNLI